METIGTNARRNFLLAATFGGAGAVVVAAAAHTGPRVIPASATAETEKSGYRASPHVLTYYKTAGF